MEETKVVNEESLEVLFEKLETLASHMETDSLSLEESFSCYKKGLDLIKECNSRIEKIEKQVMVLNEDGDCHEF